MKQDYHESILIKLFEPNIDKNEIIQVSDVIRSKFWASGSGINYVRKFEENFCNYIQSKNCTAVSNGTAALHLTLSLFNLKNKEVLVPSLTFISSVSSITQNGGIPVFVDINPENLCIDINDMIQKITRNTGAIVIVDFGGMPSNFDVIKKIAKEKNIPVIEDAAHSAGSTYKGKKIGSHFDAVCFSFHPVKNLAMPTGGAICLNNMKSESFKKKLHSLRWCGIQNRKGYDYDIKKLGWNYYMNEISAAIGLVQLKKLDKNNNIRKKNSKIFFDELKIDNKMPFSDNCSYHFYWIRVKNRTKFRMKLMSKGIETGTHYKPIHTFSYYKSKQNLPITEKVSQEIVTLPTHPNLSDEDVEKIISIINKSV